MLPEKIYFPYNYFTALIGFGLNPELQSRIVFEQSGKIAQILENNHDAVGLIPSLEILSHRELLISKTFGITFDEQIAISYYYFKPREDNITEIKLSGDISINEEILTKIIFKEKFGLDIQVALSDKPLELGSADYIMAGNANFKEELLEKSFSITDQVCDLIELPYVNFLLASKNEILLRHMNNAMGSIDKNIQDNAGKVMKPLLQNDFLYEYFMANIGSVYFKLNDDDLKGLDELLKLPFLHLLSEDIPEPKFIGM